jgi:hypothetical protein
MKCETGTNRTELEQMYEHGLPEYLQHDLDAYKEGLRTNSSLFDCLRGELYGSINMAAISDGIISSEHADICERSIYLIVMRIIAKQHS